MGQWNENQQYGMRGGKTRIEEVCAANGLVPWASGKVGCLHSDGGKFASTGGCR